MLIIVQPLVLDVEALVADGTLTNSEGNSLTSKLDSALKSLVRGNVFAASNQLLAFTNQVQALIASGLLSSQDGGELIADAMALWDQLNG